MNITRRFLLWGAAAVAAVQSVKPVSAALPSTAPAASWPVASWVPEGWLPCWGQSVSRKEYAKLFALIGDTYGETDGETFVMPGFRKAPPYMSEFKPAFILEQLVATGDGQWGPTGVIVDFARPVE